MDTPKGRRWFPSIPKSIWVFFAIYSLVFFALACRKFVAMNSNSGDTAILVNAFWHTIHGRLFYSTYMGMSHLGIHATYVMLLFVPVFALAPSAYTLFLVQTLMISVSGLVFFCLARRVTGDLRAASLMTVAYLFYPSVVTNHVNQIHFEHFALPFLMGALLCLEEKRFWGFLVCVLLAMSAVENIFITVVGIAVYALVSRRGAKWCVAPLALAMIYTAFVFHMATPHFSAGKAYFVGSYFGELGNTPGEALLTLLRRPQYFLEILTSPDRLIYLVEMLQPLLLLIPFGSWGWLVAAPSLGTNLVIPDSAFRVVAWHFNPTTGAMLCVAALLGLNQWAGWLNKKFGWTEGRIILAFGMCVLSIGSWPLWFNLEDYRYPDAYETLEKARELVPSSKSVLAPHTMIGHFADREAAVIMQQFNPTVLRQDTWPKEKMYDLDYIILNGNERRFPLDAVSRDLVMSYYTNTNYELILNENNVFVFRRHESVNLTP